MLLSLFRRHKRVRLQPGFELICVDADPCDKHTLAPILGLKRIETFPPLLPGRRQLARCRKLEDERIVTVSVDRGYPSFR